MLLAGSGFTATEASLLGALTAVLPESVRQDVSRALAPTLDAQLSAHLAPAILRPRDLMNAAMTAGVALQLEGVGLPGTVPTERATRLMEKLRETYWLRAQTSTAWWQLTALFSAMPVDTVELKLFAKLCEARDGALGARDLLRLYARAPATFAAAITDIKKTPEAEALLQRILTGQITSEDFSDPLPPAPANTTQAYVWEAENGARSGGRFVPITVDFITATPEGLKHPFFTVPGFTPAFRSVSLQMLTQMPSPTRALTRSKWPTVSIARSQTLERSAST